MRKSVVWVGIFILGFITLMFGPACYAEELRGDSDGRTANSAVLEQRDLRDLAPQNELKQGCLTATIAAINLEIDRHERWIEFRKQQGDQKGLTELQESLAALKEDLGKYRAMEVNDFVVPEKNEAVAWFENKTGKDSLLYVNSMTKNGPWYHVAGIVGDDYGKVQAKTKYHMNFYKVYPRSYWGMDSAYVYIAAIGQAEANLTNSKGLNQEIDQQPASGKRIMWGGG